MKTATGLTLLAIGAILAFAVSASPPGVNINVVGWIVMLTGVAGFLIPRRASGWLRSRVLERSGSGMPGSGMPGSGMPGSGMPGSGMPGSGMPGISGSGRPAASQDGDLAYPQYVLRDPAALASAILRDAELAGSSGDDQQTVADLSAGIRVDGWADPAPVPLDELPEGRAGPGRRLR
jgi:Domain of unknown function (DUF6458)